MWRYSFAVLVLALAGCGGDDDDDDSSGSGTIPSGTLTGTIGDAPWTFAGGRTDSFLSDPDDYFIELYATAVADCEAFPPGGNSVTVIAPRKVGEYSLGSSGASATIFVAEGSENLFAQGRLSVTEVTATTIKGGLSISFDAANSVGGEFTATICP